MVEEIRKKLFELQDLKYREFHSKLCPGIDNIIGVKIPKVRALVKEILKNDYHEYLEKVDNKYYEETMIEGLIIATSKMSLEDKLKYLEKFIPKIDNWGICDTVCASFKLKEKDLSQVWDFILNYQKSNNEFELRFMIVMMMDYFLIDSYLTKVFEIIDSVQVDYYYTNMAIAWLISVAFVKSRENTLKYLDNHRLSAFTYQKALQKIIESNRVTKEDKIMIRKMKNR